MNNDDWATLRHILISKAKSMCQRTFASGFSLNACSDGLCFSFSSETTQAILFNCPAPAGKTWFPHLWLASVWLKCHFLPNAEEHSTGNTQQSRPGSQLKGNRENVRKLSSTRLRCNFPFHKQVNKLSESSFTLI